MSRNVNNKNNNNNNNNNIHLTLFPRYSLEQHTEYIPPPCPSLTAFMQHFAQRVYVTLRIMRLCNTSPNAFM